MDQIYIPPVTIFEQLNPVDVEVSITSYVVVSLLLLDIEATLYSYGTISIAEQFTRSDGIKAQWVSFVPYAMHGLSDVHLLSQSGRSVKQL